MPFDPLPRHTEFAGRHGYYDLMAPTADMIDLEEIVISLSRLTRWGGKGLRRLSVAEHTVLCVEIARASGFSHADQRAVFAHDLHEGFFGIEMIAPLKRICPTMAMLEVVVDTVIRDKFEVEDRPEAVSYCDRAAAAVEWSELFPGRPAAWLPEPGPWRTPNLSEPRAYTAMMDLAKELDFA